MQASNPTTLDAGGTDNVTVLVGRTLRKDPS